MQVSSVPSDWIEAIPAFLPTREFLSLYPGLEALYREHLLEMDETWRDTAALLGKPLRRVPRDALVSSIVDPLEAILGGAAVERGGRFYLNQPGVGELEMHLVAEGSRKLAMLARLVVSGTLVAANSCYIGLHRTPDGVSADVGATSDEIGDITALDQALHQAERDLVRSAEVVASA